MLSVLPTEMQSQPILIRSGFSLQLFQVMHLAIRVRPYPAIKQVFNLFLPHNVV